MIFRIIGLILALVISAYVFIKINKSDGFAKWWNNSFGDEEPEKTDDDVIDNAVNAIDDVYTLKQKKEEQAKKLEEENKKLKDASEKVSEKVKELENVIKEKETE